MNPTAVPEDMGMSARGLGNLTALVQRYVDDGKYPGALSLVVRYDHVVHCETYGLMDAERHRPVRPDTIFRIYSMTKPIASVALMMLYEQGWFQLDDPVAEFIPEFGDLGVFAGGTADSYDVRAPARRMTVRDLLMHTSGLVGAGAASPVDELYRRAGIGGPDFDGTLADMVRELGKLPLQVDPGARWIYGMSTDLVGHLCEVISGEPLDRYLHSRIFAPLGIVDTGFAVSPAKADRFAAGYAVQDGPPRYTLLDDPATSAYARARPYHSGAAGLVSTAGDYLRFCRMLARDGELDGTRILGPRTLRLMTANHLPGGQDLQTVAQNGGETHRAAHAAAELRRAARSGGGADARHTRRVLLGRRRLHRVLRQPGGGPHRHLLDAAAALVELPDPPPVARLRVRRHH